MLTPWTGHLAALGAAGCWALTALFFEVAGRRIGSLSLNLIRLLLALGLLAPSARLVVGEAFPTGASTDAWLWLSASGLAGFVLGDLCLMKALLLIGPRLSTLLMSLVPLIAALLGWALLGETLPRLALAGMTLTVAGIAGAVLARHPDVLPGSPGRHPGWGGIALGVGGAFGQALGLILSKIGMEGLHPLAATEVRVVAGIAGYSLLFCFLGWWRRAARAVTDRRAMGFAALGAFFGPFLGVSLSLLAVRETAAGIAASLMATTPILVLPLVVWLRGERISAWGIAGAALAVLGAVLLFLG